MRAEGSEDGTATEGAFFASAADAAVSAVTAGAFGERALGAWLAAAITATDFAAAGRADGRSDNGVMAEGIEEELERHSANGEHSTAPASTARAESGLGRKSGNDR